MLEVNGDEVSPIEVVLFGVFGEARFVLSSRISSARAACLAWDSAVLASFPVALLLLLGGLLLLRLGGLGGLGVLAGGEGECGMAGSVGSGGGSGS